MKKILALLAVFGVLPIAALFLWSVPMDAAKWEAPENLGYVGAFAPNEGLADLEFLSIGEVHGPEDAVSMGQFLFVSSHEGKIMRIDTLSGDVMEFADTGGRPLGMEFDSQGALIAADSRKGLMSISAEGVVKLLANEVDGTPILYADDLDIAPDGTIYFTDASTRYSSSGVDGVSGGFLDILEHRNSGRLLSYNPKSRETKIVKTGLSFPNGVAIADDGKSVLVTETGEYQIRRIWVAGLRAGQDELVVKNLPGFPDNINRGPDGSYFVGLVQPRSNFLDDLSTHSNLRKLALILPQSLSSKPVEYGLVFQMDSNGKILDTWHDVTGNYAATSGALLTEDGYLYFTSAEEPRIGRKKHLR